VCSSIARAIAFSPYCDVLWMETKSPILSEAQHFASAVRAVHPHAMLAYNLSPSFNWDAAGLCDEEIRQLQLELGRCGFVWQFITLAGFHADALQISKFSRAFASDYMLAYVSMIQRQEAIHGVDTLRHQQWSGAELMDACIASITGGTASTAAMGAGNTEHQFAAKGNGSSTGDHQRRSRL
jgi:isocitrate/methylisocitrate lyase